MCFKLKRLRLRHPLLLLSNTTCPRFVALAEYAELFSSAVQVLMLLNRFHVKLLHEFVVWGGCCRPAFAGALARRPSFLFWIGWSILDYISDFLSHLSDGKLYLIIDLDLFFYRVLFLNWLQISLFHYFGRAHCGLRLLPALSDQIVLLFHFYRRLNGEGETHVHLVCCLIESGSFALSTQLFLHFSRLPRAVRLLIIEELTARLDVRHHGIGVGWPTLLVFLRRLAHFDLTSSHKWIELFHWVCFGFVWILIVIRNF